MARPPRIAAGGVVYHVLNRANAKAGIFDDDGDYLAFEHIMVEANKRIPMRLLAYAIMPNHWHMVLWPQGDGDLSRFIAWLTMTHAERWHSHRGSVGYGHLYQGRFKSFPVQTDGHFLAVCHYVEANPLRASLVTQAERWRYGSLWLSEHPPRDPDSKRPMLSPWPLTRPAGWLQKINRPQDEAELQDVRGCIQRGRPFGCQTWVSSAAAMLSLEGTLRPRGRPCKT